MLFFKLSSYVAAVWEWRDHKHTNEDFLHNHLDVIKVMTQMHYQFVEIENLMKKQSTEGNQNLVI